MRSSPPSSCCRCTRSARTRCRAGRSRSPSSRRDRGGARRTALRGAVARGAGAPPRHDVRDGADSAYAPAPSMDVLSSQSTVAGYKAVVLAARGSPSSSRCSRPRPAPSRPLRVFVIGAGVTGLQAIATARRLGAFVEASTYVPRPSRTSRAPGARLVPLPLQPDDAVDASGYANALGEAFYRRQQEHLTQVVTGVDVVIANRGGPWRAGADAAHGGRRPRDGPWIGGGRPRGRAGWQLRPLAPGRDGGRARRDGLRARRTCRRPSRPRRASCTRATS